MNTQETAVEWSLRTWKERHETGGYFPNSIQHKDWKVYAAPPVWFAEHCQPRKDDTVLEIGSGYGEWMIPIAPMVAEICGCDIHPVLVEMSAKKFASHGVTNARLCMSDGTTLPFARESFSLVYSISVFQHLPREIVLGYIREAFRVTKPGGRAVLHFRNADNVGPYPTPAKDITANHTGDFSCGWTADEVLAAGHSAWPECRVVDIGLHLLLVARKG
jgi:SAM-dependent methyltransferase